MDSRVLDLDAVAHIGVVAASIASVDIVAVHEEGTKTTLAASAGLIAGIIEQLSALSSLPVVTHVLGIDHLLGRTATEGAPAFLQGPAVSGSPGPAAPVPSGQPAPA